MFLNPIEVPEMKRNDALITEDESLTWYSLKSNTVQTEAWQFADFNLPLYAEILD